MSKENNKSQNEQQPKRFDQQQYDMLKRCSDKKKDMTEWNEWRKRNRDKDILLEGANFHGCCLSGAFLNTGAVVINPGTSLHEQWVLRGQVYLRGASFLQAQLHAIDFRGAHLEEAVFNLAGLEGGCLELAHLQRATFKGATFDKWTSFEGCHIDKRAEFRESDMTNLRVSPWIRQLMEYNVRRKNWEDWYKQHKILKWPVWLFWLISDYGISAPRLIGVFVVSAVAFAFVYYLWGIIAPPGIIDNLIVDGNGVKVASWLVPIRVAHFSVVIMTVGFTNMHANAHSFWAHILVGLQMILGFVLLGALVTRFAVLFTAGGPAGKFADENKKDADDNVS
jgi:hypothetical protein